MRNFNKRSEKEYNWFRTLFTNFLCRYIYGLYYKIWYKMEVQGLENFDKKNSSLVIAANHLSAIDPFLIAGALKRPVAFMAKEQLFENPFSRLIMNLCGAFAVNRDKLEVSTIKTALSIKKTNWALGLFPQGTREISGSITRIQKGFAALAKTMKSNILPVAVINTDKKSWFPFKEKIIIKIGEEIPYSDNIDSMVEQWKEAILKLTGFEYKPQENC